jgi:prevent-host-death family protein
MNIAEAKAKLSALVQKALDGEEVILARDGKPVARIVAVDAAEKPKRQFGSLKLKYGWTEETPYEVFAPDPADATESPLFPDEKVD